MELSHVVDLAADFENALNAAFTRNFDLQQALQGQIDPDEQRRSFAFVQRVSAEQTWQVVAEKTGNATTEERTQYLHHRLQQAEIAAERAALVMPTEDLAGIMRNQLKEPEVVEVLAAHDVPVLTRVAQFRPGN
jgi:hypothetical protein